MKAKSPLFPAGPFGGGGGDDWNSAPGWEDAEFEEECVSDADVTADTAADARTASPDQAKPDTSAAPPADNFRTQDAASEASSDTHYDSCSDTEAFEPWGPNSRGETSPLSAGGHPSWAKSPVGASELIQKRAVYKRGGENDKRSRESFSGGQKRLLQGGGSEEDMDEREGSLAPVKDLWLMKVRRRIHEPITQVRGWILDLYQFTDSFLSSRSGWGFERNS